MYKNNNSHCDCPRIAAGTTVKLIELNFSYLRTYPSMLTAQVCEIITIYSELFMH